MLAATKHEALKYLNQNFAIHHLIEDCPAHTVVRELTKNAEENTCQLTPPGKIEWFVEKVGGVNKLGLFNEGPSMSADELSRLMDMASTGKTLGVEQNFGQGGKVTGLKVSPAGLVYRSCKGGAVNQITLRAEHPEGADHPVYVKVRVNVAPPGQPEYLDTVEDITAHYRNRKGRALDKEWTEVLLIGRREDQDTVADLLPEARGTNWLIRHINQRFYRFPEGISIRNADITSGQKNARSGHGLEVETLNCCREGDGRYEDVQAEHPYYGPVTIRYCKLRGNVDADRVGDSRAATMRAYGIGSRGDHIAVVWKDECYGFTPGWSRISGPFGVTFGSANVAIHVMLPDTAPVKNNTYRDQLLRKDDSGDMIEVMDFADLVFHSRPQWLIDYVEEQGRRNTSSNNVMERLRQYLQQMMTAGSRRQVVEPGDGDDTGDAPGGNGTGKRGDGSGRNGTTRQSHQPARGRRTNRATDGIPDVQFTHDPGHLAEMNGRAALYRPVENQVLLNPNHFLYQDHLTRILAEAGADADRRQIAQQIFNDEYTFQAGRFIIQAWLFRGRADWNDNQFVDALNMGAMTVYLASPDTLAEASRRYRQRMATNRMAAAAG
jgi:hypothetical protein